MPGCFVFRTADDEKSWVWEEIQQGRLRQGWGHSKSALMADDTRRDRHDWIADYLDGIRTLWADHDTTEEQATRRHDILSRMLDIRLGDRIVVPKMPECGSFAILESTGRYQFDPAADDWGDDYRHIIPVRVLTIITHNSRGDAMEVQKALRGYQTAVNNVWSERLKDLVESLITDPPPAVAQDIAKLVSGFPHQFLQELLNRLRTLPPRQLERLIHSIFQNQGYTVEATQSYDRQGGDADLIASRPLPVLSAIDEFDQKIYIQIKQKAGEDHADHEGIEQLVRRAAGDRSPILILMSTADKFSDECKRQASENGVLLLGGTRLARALLPYL
jgi:restriction endonuclease Mrr